MLFQPWWERYPEVLREEEADLERLAGRPPVLDERFLREAKVRRYDLQYNHEGTAYDLTVAYSDFHPYFRVEVTTPHRFTTHQHPFSGNLCLIRGGTWNWNVDETAAQLIETQLPLLLMDQARALADRGEDHGERGADGHVEPFVEYYTYAPGSAIRVDGSWAELAESDGGTFVLGLDQPPNAAALRGTVLQIRDHAGAVLRQADPPIAGYLIEHRITGRWCRLRERPAEDAPHTVLAAAEAMAPALGTPTWHRVGRADLDVVGVVFTDGIRPGVDDDAWLFVVRGRGRRPQQSAPGKGSRRSGRVTPERERIGPYLARAFRAGRSDMAERVPSLSPLATKKVVVLGAGGVGASSILEFAKAGVGTLVVVEWDLIHPGNGPRWPMGFLAAGLHKLEGLQQLVRGHWPYTELKLVNLRLGAVRSGAGSRPEWEVLAETLEGADLLYDATAEVGISYFLSEIAKEYGIPYVVASATEGGWGGRVARFRPGKEQPCWTCLMHYEEDDPSMVPPADPDPATRQVWPAGCTDPTFTGTGFDVAGVALAGVRIAVSTLCEGDAESYPSIDWDVAVYKFRDKIRALAGDAETFVLGHHPDCKPCHIRRSG